MEAQEASISFFITNYIIEFMQMTVVLCSIDSKTFLAPSTSNNAIRLENKRLML